MMESMTHMVSLTKEEAQKLASDGKLYEVVESKKDEKTTHMTVGENAGKALEHWARYQNLHSPGFALYHSLLSVRRARVESLELLDGIQIGAIASEEDALNLGLSVDLCPDDDREPGEAGVLEPA
jgi:thiamine biosynthesis protein ThiC